MDVSLANISSHSLGCLFVLLMASFADSLVSELRLGCELWRSVDLCDPPSEGPDLSGPGEGH